MFSFVSDKSRFETERNLKGNRTRSAQYTEEKY